MAVSPKKHLFIFGASLSPMSFTFQETIEKFVRTFENKQAQQEPKALHVGANGCQKILYFVCLFCCVWTSFFEVVVLDQRQRPNCSGWPHVTELMTGFPLWVSYNETLTTVFLYVQAGIKTDWQPKSWDTPTVRGKLPSFVLIQYFFDVASVVSGYLVREEIFTCSLETLQAKDFSSLFVKRSLL